MNSTLNQGYALLLFVYAGIVLGILYDLTRFIRLATPSRMAGLLSDAVFALLFGAVSMAAFYFTTGCAIRLYGFVCMGAGMAMEQWAVGRPICKFIVNREKARSHFR